MCGWCFAMELGGSAWRLSTNSNCLEFQIWIELVAMVSVLWKFWIAWVEVWRPRDCILSPWRVGGASPGSTYCSDSFKDLSWYFCPSGALLWLLMVLFSAYFRAFRWCGCCVGLCRCILPKSIDYKYAHYSNVSFFRGRLKRHLYVIIAFISFFMSYTKYDFLFQYWINKLWFNFIRFLFWS